MRTWGLSPPQAVEGTELRFKYLMGKSTIKLTTLQKPVNTTFFSRKLF